MDNERLRYYDIIVRWKDNITKKFMERTYTVACTDEESARKIAKEKENSVLTDDSSNIKSTVYDKGFIQKNSILYSSSPTIERISMGDNDTNKDYNRVLIHFAILWGIEIGWRHIKQAETDKEKADIIRLRNNKDLPKILTSWVNEFIAIGGVNEKDFFYEKLKNYLNSDSLTIQDITPMDDTEYGKIIAHANLQAEEYIKSKEDADKQSRMYLDEIKKILDNIKTTIKQNQDMYQMIQELHSSITSGNFHIDTSETSSKKSKIQDSIKTEVSESTPDENNFNNISQPKENVSETTQNEDTTPEITPNVSYQDKETYEPNNETVSSLPFDEPNDETYRAYLASANPNTLKNILEHIPKDVAVIRIEETDESFSIATGLNTIIYKNSNDNMHETSWNQTQKILCFIKDDITMVKSEDNPTPISAMEYVYNEYKKYQNNIDDDMI